MILALLGLVALAAPPEDPLLDLLDTELDRATSALSDADEPPHYAALAVTDTTTWSVGAQDGTLSTQDVDRQRILDVDLRVGSPALDSTRELRGFSGFDGARRRPVRLPLDEDGAAATRLAIWRELDSQYRDAGERILMIRAERTVKVAEEIQADDFEPREGIQDSVPVPTVDPDLDAWAPVLVRLSELADTSPVVHGVSAYLRVTRQITRFVDTEDARLRHGRTHGRLHLSLSTVAEDGDNVRVFRAFDVHDPTSLPEPAALDDWTREAVSHLEALREAPRGTPYSGPVLLRGRASAVFFHEVFGHRVEGHRQKSETEGRTFAAKVGEPILPDFIDVYDDPTLRAWEGTDLNGHYVYDDEGVAGQRAELVEDGRFAGFLMGRSPLPEHSSNGHGRRQAGRPPVSRMANTIVEASETISREALRQQLLREVRSQGLEYGYIVGDIDGGFTLTGRVMPNAFNVRANTTWRVYADGRPDELVRGIDLVGTPLVAFRNVVAASDTYEVFNGSCGAESGWVPVSAVAPDLLVRRLEFQLKEKGQERPPLLPKPSPADDGTAEAP